MEETTQWEQHGYSFNMQDQLKLSSDKTFCCSGLVHTYMRFVLQPFFQPAVLQKYPRTHQQYFKIISPTSNCMCRLSGDVKPISKQKVAL